jgi:hypothetical protein
MWRANAVTLVAENNCAHRHETHCMDREDFQYTDPRIGAREKQLCEREPGESAVWKETVPLDGGADCCGDYGTAKLELMFARTERNLVGHPRSLPQTAITA